MAVLVGDTMNCSCINVGMDEDGRATMLTEKIVTARIQHKCCECGVDIVSGDKYFKEVGVYEESFLRYKTCMDCVSIRDAFFCDGWIWTTMWDSIKDHVYQSNGLISESCLADLTSIARGKICELIEYHWKETS